MKTSDYGKAFIKKHEGLRLEAYKLPDGPNYTIGYGHNGADVYPGQEISMDEANSLFERDLPRFEHAVDRYDNVYNWLQHEYDAMVDYAYNIGSIGKLCDYGCRSKQQIYDNLQNHNKSQGVVWPVLTQRRRDEQALFFNVGGNGMNAYQAGKKLLCGGYSEYTPTGKNYFVRAGRWYKVPEIGDLVYYYSASMGRVCHVGFVTGVNKGKSSFSFTACEGNTSDGSDFERNGGVFAEKTYRNILYSDVGKDTYRINGFGRPQYGSDTCSVSDMVAVERGEIGYEEKASNFALDSKHTNPGKANYTKYGAWYGDLPAQWCQQSQSWCAYQACKLHRAGQSTGWTETDAGWTYRKSDGKLCADEWIYLNGRWYVFNGAGIMITGWFASGGEWYYLNPDDGGMLSGQWVTVKGKDYYLTASGAMAKNTYIKDTRVQKYYWVGADGSYMQEWDTTTPDLDKYDVAM